MYTRMANDSAAANDDDEYSDYYAKRVHALVASCECACSTSAGGRQLPTANYRSEKNMFTLNLDLFRLTFFSL